MKTRFTVRQAAQAGLLAAAIAMLAVSGASGQTFDSQSTGADGALDLSAAEPGSTVTFDPASFDPPLDPEGDNVYHFTTITIPANVTVRLTAPRLNFAPVFWLASGAVQIDGAIALQGDNGHAAQASARSPALPGPGGFPGGVGGVRDNERGTPGSGPGGGTELGGGHATRGSFGGGAVYGNRFLLPLVGGSGGGGQTASANGTGAGGGGGGGALLIASSESIAVNGSINANGGLGYTGGSGGAIRLLAPVVSGTGGLRAGGGSAPGTNRHGGAGRVRIEAFENQFRGSFAGDWTAATLSPAAVFLPTGRAPGVRVVRVAGNAVPASPGGSFTMPDVSIGSTEPVTVEIEARHIPPGTVVRLHVFSESAATQTVDTTPLAGTSDLSMATAAVTVPHGFSRLFVRATWN